MEIGATVAPVRTQLLTSSPVWKTLHFQPYAQVKAGTRGTTVAILGTRCVSFDRAPAVGWVCKPEPLFTLHPHWQEFARTLLGPPTRHRLVRGQVLAATVPDAQHIDHIAVDGEEYPVKVRLVAVQQLSHLERHGSVFRR